MRKRWSLLFALVLAAPILTAGAARAATSLDPAPPYRYTNTSYDPILDKNNLNYFFVGYGCYIDSDRKLDTPGKGSPMQPGVVNGVRTNTCRSGSKVFPAYAFYATRPPYDHLDVIRIGGPGTTTDQKGAKDGVYFAYYTIRTGNTTPVSISINYDTGVNPPTTLTPVGGSVGPNVPDVPFKYTDATYSAITDKSNRKYDFVDYGCLMDENRKIKTPATTATFNGTPNVLVCEPGDNQYPAFAYYATQADKTNGGFRVVRVGGKGETSDQKGGDSGSYFAYLSNKKGDFTATTDGITISCPASSKCQTSLLANGNASGGAAGDDSTKCTGAEPFNWVVCPLISLSLKAVSGVETGLILPLLQTKPMTPDSSNSVYIIWGLMRNLADVGFVLAFIVVIFSNTLTIGLDAYAVKKTLPRLVIAVVAVQFSFVLAAALVDLSNVLGIGLAGLISDALKGTQSSANIDINLATGGLGLATVLGGLTVAGLSLLGGGLALLGAIGLLLLSGFLAVLGVFFTLLFRQIAIALLIILAPLAFVAWILPNTESLFKKWYTNFFKILMMYPLIVLIIEGGKVVAIAAGSIGSNGATQSTLVPIFQIAALIVPLFMIPAALKMSGTIMGTVGGAIMSRANGYGKGLRQGELQKNLRASSKERAAKRVGMGNALQRASARIGSGNALSFGTIGRRKMMSQANAARIQEQRDSAALISESGIKNPQVGEALEAFVNGEKDFSFEDANGKKRKIAFTDPMVEAMVAHLNTHGGQTELANILDGPVIDAATGQRDHTRGIFNHAAGKGFQDPRVQGDPTVSGEAKTVAGRRMEAIWRRGLEGNGYTGQKLVHGVHGKGLEALPRVGVGGLEQLGSGEADTYSSYVTSTPDSARLALGDWIKATQKSDFNGDTEVAMRFREHALASGVYDTVNMDVDGTTMTGRDWVESAITPDGKVNYSLANVTIIP